MSVQEELRVLSVAAHRELLDREEREGRPALMESFLSEQRFAARWVREQISERDSTPADAVLGFLADGKMDDEPRAAIVARREYDAFLLRYGAPRPEDVVEYLLSFYLELGRAWREASVAI